MKKALLLPAAFNNQLFSALALHFIANNKPLPPEIFESKPLTHPSSKLLMMLPNESSMDEFLDKHSGRRTVVEKVILAGLFFRAHYASLLEQKTVAELNTLFLPRFESALKQVAELVIKDELTIDEAFARCYPSYGALLMANKADFAPFVVQRLVQEGQISAEDRRVASIAPMVCDFQRLWQERGLQNVINAAKSTQLAISLADVECQLATFSLEVEQITEAPSEDAAPNRLYLFQTDDAPGSLYFHNEQFVRQFNKQLSMYQFYCQSGLTYDVSDIEQGFLLPSLTIAPERALDCLTQTVALMYESQKAETYYMPFIEAISTEDADASLAQLEQSFRELLRNRYYTQQDILQELPGDFIDDWAKAESGGDILKLQNKYLDEFDVQTFQAFVDGYQRYYKSTMYYVYEKVSKLSDKTVDVAVKSRVLDFVNELLQKKDLSEFKKLLWLTLIDSTLTNLSDICIERFVAIAQQASFDDKPKRFAFFKAITLRDELLDLATWFKRSTPLVELVTELSSQFAELDGQWFRHAESSLALAIPDMAEGLSKHQALCDLFDGIDIDVTICSDEIVLSRLSYDKLKQLEAKSVPSPH